MAKVRIDKWLWSIRIFKSRTLATDACKSGKVRIGEEPVKASYLLSENEIVTVKKEGFNLQFRSIQLIEKRVGAPIAVTCYEDVTPEEEKKQIQSLVPERPGSYRKT
jgi:ribosome-associated heat shock protein Hsp15